MFTVHFKVFDNLANTNKYGFIADNGKAVINSERASKGWKTRQGAEKAANKIEFSERYSLVEMKIKG